MMTNGEPLSTAAGAAELRPRAFETILYGGLAIGVLDFLDASLYFGLYSGAPFQRIWQGVASGLLGRDASRAGGWETAVLGIFLHFVIAFCVATVFYIGARNIAFLVRHPLISGPVFGVLAHLVMKFVVVPLSAIGTAGPYTTSEFLHSVIGHAIFVGLPVAFIARWSATRHSPVLQGQ